MKTPDAVAGGQDAMSGEQGCAVQDEPKAESFASPKIHPKHHERLAIVYVRQSSPQQVLNNRESRERQYALVERAVELGWPRDRVRIVDEDQGQTAKSADHRNGFQQILVDVGLDHVGLVLGLEMNRMSRSCRDAYHLMEVCGIFSTLLADFDGVYDPTDINDRLLLGLKATISEMELHTMRNRLLLGKLNKARRGELFTHAPMGYVRTADGEVAMDPDEQVQGVIELIFATFSELKSVNAVLRYLAQTGVRLPVRPRSGPHRGQIEWRRPNRSTLQAVLRHPIYAGAYCYGRHRVDPRRARSGRPGSGVQRVAPEDAEVLLHDRLPAYISWQQFQENQRQMAENRSKYDTRGVPRAGVALLAGLLVCGRCGYRMRVSYGRNRNQGRYMCTAQQTLHGCNSCQSLEGESLDKLVGQQVLRALEPAAIELSLAAGASIEQERQRQQQQWKLRLERAQYETDRAARQYHAVEPENRLVARELERAWEHALTAQRELEEEFARWRHEAPSRLTAEEKARIEQLARDIPALWNAASTNEADRKAIVRHLVERVVINVEGNSEDVQATIHWAGGFESQHQFHRHISSYEQLVDYERLLERVAELHTAGQSRAQIAKQLNAEGYHPPQRSDSFGISGVAKLLSHLRAREHGNQSSVPASEVGSDATFVSNEWWPSDLAKELDMPLSTIRAWRRKGWISARKCSGWPSRWIYYTNEPELERLRRLRAFQRPHRKQPMPTELTTPISTDS